MNREARIEFRRDYLLWLQLPLAQHYRITNHPTPRTRHDAAYYLFESTIKLLASVLVAATARS